MSSQAWKKKNTQVFYIRTMNNSDIAEAMRIMTEKTGEKDTVYIRRILRERLIADGFMPENKAEE